MSLLKRFIIKLLCSLVLVFFTLTTLKASERDYKINLITMKEFIKTAISLKSKLEGNRGRGSFKKEITFTSKQASLVQEYFFIDEIQEKRAIILKLNIELAFFHHNNITVFPLLTYYEKNRETMTLNELIYTLRFTSYAKQILLKKHKMTGMPL